MVKIPSIAETLTEASTLVKAIIATFALVAALSAFYVGARSVLSVPGTLAAHDVMTQAEFKSLDKLLCLAVADHRKIDWHLCFINPSQVMPIDGTH